MPPFLYQPKFWEAVSWLVAGVLAMLAFFGVVDTEYAYTAGAIFAFAKALLKLFGVTWV